MLIKIVLYDVLYGYITAGRSILSSLSGKLALIRHLLFKNE